MASNGASPASVSGELAIRLIREGLEAVMAPELASSVVFAALEQGGGQDLPSTRRDALRFVEGPLSAVLLARVGAGNAEEAMKRVRELLDRALASSDAPTFQTTMRLPSVAGPVSVMLLSASASLGVRLRASLGGEKVTVHVVGHFERALDGARRMPPDVFVLDVDYAQTCSPEELVDLGKQVAKGVAFVLWGAEHPKADKSLKALKKNAKTVVPMDRRGGIDPLLDFVKARQASPAR